MKTEIFTDENYRSEMDSTVKSWWNSSIESVEYQSFDRTKIQGYCAVHPEASASIVMVHGFTEYAKRFAEMMYYFYQEGYSVFMYDQRGHGRSGRKIKNPHLVYVRDFDEYVEDLYFFVTHIVRQKAPRGKLFLFAHSMGGCISALFLEKYPDIFDRAVLSSPMLKMELGDYPDLVIKGLAAFSKMAKWGAKPAPGAGSFSDEPDFEHSCATSKARYLYHLEQAASDRHYQTSGATYAWAVSALNATARLQKNAGEAKVPILICQAGMDELVDNEGQNTFTANAPQVTLIRFPTAKHEIYRSTKEVLEEYYRTIFNFLK